MSQQYDEYLHEHISNVIKGLYWMLDHGIIPIKVAYSETGSSLTGAAKYHDETKYGPEEYDAYDDYFYGKEGRDQDDIAVIDSAFDYAWLHHLHNNPHHWQYWVLINDDDGMRPLRMPENHMYEMIADWWSFSWKSRNLKAIFGWYEDHKDRMILHEETRAGVEAALAKMRDILSTDEKTGEDDDGEASS